MTLIDNWPETFKVSKLRGFFVLDKLPYQRQIAQSA